LREFLRHYFDEWDAAPLFDEDQSNFSSDDEELIDRSSAEHSDDEIDSMDHSSQEAVDDLPAQADNGVAVLDAMDIDDPAYQIQCCSVCNVPFINFDDVKQLGNNRAQNLTYSIRSVVKLLCFLFILEE